MARRTAGRPDNLYDYIPTGARSPLSRRATAISQSANNGVIRVTDDWPEIVPISEAELRVVEGHLSEVLDVLFGPKP